MVDRWDRVCSLRIRFYDGGEGEEDLCWVDGYVGVGWELCFGKAMAGEC